MFALFTKVIYIMHRLLICPPDASSPRCDDVTIEAPYLLPGKI